MWRTVCTVEIHSSLVHQHLTGPSRQRLSRIWSRQTQRRELTRACPGRRARGAVQVRPAVPAHEAGGANAAAHSTDSFVNQQCPQVRAAPIFLQCCLAAMRAPERFRSCLVAGGKDLPTGIPSALPGCMVEATLVLCNGSIPTVYCMPHRAPAWTTAMPTQILS